MRHEHEPNLENRFRTPLSVGMHEKWANVAVLGDLHATKDAIIAPQLTC
jgi:hypothetical protein